MSKCSQKCNEIKEKINSISGLDDDTVFDWLKRLESITNAIIDIIDSYADRNELNGTCFNKDVIDIDTLLINHNIMPGYLGYTYIKTILESNILNSDITLQGVYRIISKKYNTSSITVERNIRTVLSKSNIHKSNRQSLYLLQLEYEGE